MGKDQSIKFKWDPTKEIKNNSLKNNKEILTGAQQTDLYLKIASAEMILINELALMLETISINKSAAIPRIIIPIFTPLISYTPTICRYYIVHV